MNSALDSGDRPLVSVCVPTYNRRVLLEQTLQTISDQSFRDFELIVCDDSSTDGTFEFLSSLSWPNLRILRNESNLNLPATMTRLFSAARGTYIGMQHDHDLYQPDFLEKMVAMMERQPTAGFGCCGFFLLGTKGEVLEAPSSWFDFYPASGLRAGSEVIKALATQVFTPIPAMGTMFRREVVELSGGYRPDWFIASDEDLYRRVAASSDVAFTRERLFMIRTRPPERHTVLGSWKAIYTLHEFRVDTSRRFLNAAKLKKEFYVARLRFLRLRALLRECASLGIRGQIEQLKDATKLDAIPKLPSAPTLNVFERLVIGSWVLTLRVLCPLIAAWIPARGERRVG